MEINKIKIKQDRVTIDYSKIHTIGDNNTFVNKYSIDSPEQPTEAFKKAFQNLDFHFIEICEFANKQEDIAVTCEDVKITGITLKHKEGVFEGAIITGTKQLAYSNSPLVVNTPIKLVNYDDEFDRMKHFTDPALTAIKKVIEHAEEYVNGKRLQVEIDLKDKQEEEVPAAQQEIDTDKPKETEPKDEPVGESPGPDENPEKTDTSEPVADKKETEESSDTVGPGNEAIEKPEKPDIE